MNKQERDELREKFLGEVVRLHKDKVIVELKFNEGIEPLLCFNFLSLIDQLDAQESVVEAAREYVKHVGIDGYFEKYSKLKKALEGLEDE